MVTVPPPPKACGRGTGSRTPRCGAWGCSAWGCPAVCNSGWWAWAPSGSSLRVLGCERLRWKPRGSRGCWGKTGCWLNRHPEPHPAAAPVTSPLSSSPAGRWWEAIPQIRQIAAGWRAGLECGRSAGLSDTGLRACPPDGEFLQRGGGCAERAALNAHSPRPGRTSELAWLQEPGERVGRGPVHPPGGWRRGGVCPSVAGVAWGSDADRQAEPRPHLGPRTSQAHTLHLPSHVACGLRAGTRAHFSDWETEARPEPLGQ